MRKSDFELQSAVLDRIRRDERLSSSDIGIAVRDGVATLHGEVDSLAKRSAAARDALDVSGVIAIANDLIVRIPGDKRRSDAAIAEDVVNALAWDTEVPENTIKARVQDQWVWLVGECDCHFQRQAAQRAVENVAGIRGVVNAVRLKHSLPNPLLRLEVERALARHALLSSRIIDVSVDNDVNVALDGTVHSWEERTAAEQVAWSAGGVRSVENRLEIAS